MTTDLSTTCGPLRLSGPIIGASGCFGYGTEFSRFFDIAEIGGFVTKGLSLQPRLGNPTPRTVETPSGMINSIGLENVGVDAFIDEKLPAIRATGALCIANIYGYSPDDYAGLAARLDGCEGVAALEINVSCPNVKAGGQEFGLYPEPAAEVTAACREKTDLPLIVKLSPNAADLSQIAAAVKDAGADAVSLINTIGALEVDPATRKPVLGNGYGGLSGPAIRTVAQKMVWQVYRAVDIPIIGIGGIMSAEDAARFIVCGACAVQVGTANFVNPTACLDITRELAAWCEANGVASIEELRGTLDFDR